MPKDWKSVKAEIDAENKRIRLDPPEEIVKIFRYGIVESGAGTHGQCLTTWVFTEGDCRYLAFYGANNVVFLASNPLFSLEHLKAMARLFLPLSAEFLGYCGLKKLWAFVQDLLASLDTLETKEDFVELMSSFCLYTATLNAWIQHYFQWDIGTLFPQRKPEEIAEMAKFVSIGG